MKRFYYDSKIAKILLAFSSCHTVTVGPFVFSKLTESNIPQRVRNHETCHSYQWIEMVIVVGSIVLILQLVVDISPWWYLVAIVAFYLWYAVEWLIRLFIYKDSKTAYRKVSFEQEAYSSEQDCNYIENRLLFSGWMQYLRKI